MTRAATLIIAAFFYSAAAATSPPVTFDSPCECRDALGKHRCFSAVHMMQWFAFTMPLATWSFFSARSAQWCGPADS